MILTQHGMNSMRSLAIGGRVYKVVTLGGKVWLAENLDYKFSGCDIGPSGTPSTPAAWYFDNSEVDSGIDGVYKLGLMYNWYAVEYLQNNRATLCPGWHVPSQQEWNDMLTAVGNDAGTALKAQDNSITSLFPTGWNGTDTTGMGILPGGRYNGTFGLLGTDGRYWTSDVYSATAAVDKRFTSASSVGGNTNYKYIGYSVRLVKD